MRRGVFFLVLALFIFWEIPVWAQPDITGKSAVLIDAGSGQILYDKDRDEKLPPASTTKILTAILAIESGKLEELVTIGPNPPRVEGTRVYLEEGEKVKLKDLVLAAMIHSANDAALAIAEYLGETSEAFALQMNAKAREIGANNSNFVNPHGLSAENHYSSAYDLALIGRYAMNNQTFRDIVQEKVLDWEGQAWQTRLININRLLWRYDGADGIKTGYTTEARSTIVASADRDGRRYIAVVLATSGGAVWDEAEALLDYGFKNFKTLEIADSNTVAAMVNLKGDDKQLQLVPGNDFSVSLPQNGDSKVESKLVLKPVQGSVAKGEVMGQLIFDINGTEVGRVELLAAEAVKKSFDFNLFFLKFGAGLFCLQILWRTIVYFGRRRRRGSAYRSAYRSTYKEYRGY